MEGGTALMASDKIFAFQQTGVWRNEPKGEPTSRLLYLLRDGPTAKRAIPKSARQCAKENRQMEFYKVVALDLLQQDALSQMVGGARRTLLSDFVS